MILGEHVALRSITLRELEERVARVGVVHFRPVFADALRDERVGVDMTDRRVDLDAGRNVRAFDDKRHAGHLFIHRRFSP